MVSRGGGTGVPYSVREIAHSTVFTEKRDLPSCSYFSVQADNLQAKSHFSDTRNTLNRPNRKSIQHNYQFHAQLIGFVPRVR